MTLQQEGLRERRRRQTEQEIAEVALHLFERDGVDATTVDAIAAEAGVSPRTFFRYFPTKERAALLVHVDIEERTETLVDRLTARRAIRPQLEAIFEEIATAYGDGTTEAGERLGRVRRLMCVEPHLRLAANALGEERREDLVARVTLLLDGQDDAALRARVLVDRTVAVFRAAVDTWALQLDADRAAHPLPEVYARARAVR